MLDIIQPAQEPSNTARRNIPLVTNSWCNWCLKIHTSSPSTTSLSSCSWNRMFFAVWSAQLRLRCVCVDDCYYSWIAAWLAPHLAESGWTGNRANDPPGDTRAITETQSTSKCVSDRDVLQTKPLDSLDYWNKPCHPVSDLEWSHGFVLCLSALL